jgi:tRNA(Arg) A34 adenosine deaminase TadA
MKLNTKIQYLELAILLAEEGINKGHGPFGAVIVKNDEIIAKAANSVTLKNDPTAHAEVLAIREAALSLGTPNLEGCEIYTSCEPCPMCLGAIYWAGIKKVIYAADRVDAADAGFNDKFIYDEISLDPIDRKVEFLKVNHPKARTLLETWKKFEGKIPY